MSLWRELARGLRGLINRPAADRDIADEVEQYVDEAAASFEARGLSPEEARRAALRELGSVTAVREQVRAYGWENIVETTLADVRYAARRLRRYPIHALVAALTLALGIGASTAIFSAVNPVLFQPLPYPDPQRLMPEAFRFQRDPELILPQRFERHTQFLGGFGYQGLARLKSGVTLEQADADVARMLVVWLNAWPPNPGINRAVFQNARVEPRLRALKQDVIGDIGTALWVVMGTLGLVLLIACANVANLLLARGLARGQEIAIRAALEIGRAHV